MRRRVSNNKVKNSSNITNLKNKTPSPQQTQKVSNNPPNKYKNVVQKPIDNSNKKISIVMTQFNRKPQVLFTLETISRSSYKNVEVILVDDASNDNHKFTQSDIDKIKEKLNFKYVYIDPKEKTHINPCVAYNIGFGFVTGDITIIQNGEVCHIGDILSYVINNFRERWYITFPCFSLSTMKENERLWTTEYTIPSVKKFMKGVGRCFPTVSNWLNSESFFTGYNYLTVIDTNILNKRLKGFDLAYANGICSDDDDFIHRVRKERLAIKLARYNDSTPFCIHQWHPRSEFLKPDKKKVYWKRNNLIFKEKMRKLGIKKYDNSFSHIEY